MLKKLHDKSPIWFAVAWIIAYCVLMSVGDSLSVNIGVEKSLSLLAGVLLSGILAVFFFKNGLASAYGLSRPKASMRSMLYYVPLLLLLTANLWYGVTLHYGWGETVLYILTMFCVGFLEEIIFRGLLFNALRRDSEKTAILISSVTFGMGHIINLFNGSGAELVPNLLQVVYATAAGFMFVMIYLRTDSLIMCILTHGVFNALSVFATDSPQLSRQILSCVLLTVITGAYGIYIAHTMGKEHSSKDRGNKEKS